MRKSISKLLRHKLRRRKRITERVFADTPFTSKCQLDLRNWIAIQDDILCHLHCPIPIVPVSPSYSSCCGSLDSPSDSCCRVGAGPACSAASPGLCILHNIPHCDQIIIREKLVRADLCTMLTFLDKDDFNKRHLVSPPRSASLNSTLHCPG